jgi:hypothetical protein
LAKATVVRLERRRADPAATADVRPVIGRSAFAVSRQRRAESTQPKYQEFSQRERR